MKRKQPGFTLIELLVVIGIIGILSTLAIIALGNTRAKSRDSKRITDIKQISSALELYYADNGSYPTIITPGNSLISPDGAKVYMSKIPTNPTPRTDGSCTNNEYIYTPSNNNQAFTLNTCIGSQVNNLNAGIITYTQLGFIGSSEGSPSSFTCGTDNVTDSYNNTYNTIEIGAQCWMKENMKVGDQIEGSSEQTDNATIEKYCYEDLAEFCENYGGLYQWAEAVQYLNNASNTEDWDPAPSGNVQGICPTGWHIPSFDEYQTLARVYDTDCELDCSEAACNCSTAGGLLKAIVSHDPVGWDGTSPDDNGFSALPSGIHEPGGVFSGRNDNTFIWTASNFLTSSSDSWYLHLNSGDNTAIGGNGGRNQAFMVRCVKD